MTTKEKQVAEFKALYAKAGAEDRARITTLVHALYSGQVTTDQVKAAARSDNPRAFADSLASLDGGRAQA